MSVRKGMLHDFDWLEDSSKMNVNSDRKCLIFKKGELPDVFLPCAHQVLCVNCNDKLTTTGRRVYVPDSGFQLNRESGLWCNSVAPLLVPRLAS
ncbi:hypothetical protein T459_15869 [Capsicum annuum]|uniref:Uncharacterized protein n=1 Tax=Capsicum annuum TaxID=4072 RepID=A0A2G2Z732_CAPAN|nr:hypothetical protein T459_15869 [Capsicum annuum]